MSEMDTVYSGGTYYYCIVGQWYVVDYFPCALAPVCRAKQQPQPAVSIFILPAPSSPLFPSASKAFVGVLPSSAQQYLVAHTSQSGTFTVVGSTERAAPATRQRYTSHAHAHARAWLSHHQSLWLGACLARPAYTEIRIKGCMHILSWQAASAPPANLTCSAHRAHRSCLHCEAFRLARHDALFIHFASRVTRSATHRYVHA
jgi:hypothetical protein